MCTHHWILESHDANPKSDNIKGICKICNEEKDFPKYCEVIGSSWKAQADTIKDFDTPFIPGVNFMNRGY